MIFRRLFLSTSRISTIGNRVLEFILYFNPAEIKGLTGSYLIDLFD
ncbi:Uncharacterised protein [Lelliottia amnigena]|nr:hypothetical protein CCAJJPOJ_03200 [Lelliottia sp. T2.26D-8]VDZ87208.1 Uncharacterised protein [Lelliottia amnigena]